MIVPRLIGFDQVGQDFVLAHEPTLIAFCQNTATEPEIVALARDKLDGALAW